MKNDKPKDVDGFDKLHLRIVTVGYPQNGESIMVSLMHGDTELYNVITDNFEVNGFQYWTSNLPKRTRVNAFIWTHPDEDHSLGVKNLLDKFDPDGEAMIFVPTSLTEEFLVNNNRESSIPTFEYLKGRYNKGRKYQWQEVSLAIDEEPRNLKTIKLRDLKTNKLLVFKIGFMAPVGAISNRRVDTGQLSAGQMNDMSIFYVIQLNSCRYVFGGDLAKQTVQFLDEDYLSDCRYVKIPHHGSKDPIKLIEKITPDRQGMYSVATIFGATNPFDIVLDEYAKKSAGVYSTSRGEEQYGLVELDYSITGYQPVVLKLNGNAEQVRPIVNDSKNGVATPTV